MSSSVTLENNNNSIFKGKGPKKPAKNKATVTKLIIADPGVGFQLQITETEYEVMALQISVKIGPNSNSFHHTTNIGIGVLEGTLDLSVPYVFVVPFVDPNYVKEEGDYSVEINVSLYSQPDIMAEHLLVTIPILGTDTVSAADRNKKFSCKLNGGAPTFLNPLPSTLPQLTGGQVKYYDILFHELGTVYRVQLGAGTENMLNPVNFHAVLQESGNGPETNMSLSMPESESNIGFNMTNETGFAFLPHPHGVSGTAVHLNISAYYADRNIGIHFPLEGASYQSPNPLTHQTGDLKIELV